MCGHRDFSTAEGVKPNSVGLLLPKKGSACDRTVCARDHQDGLRACLGLGMLNHTLAFCQGHQGHALQQGLQQGPNCSCWASSAAAAETKGGQEVWGLPEGPQGEGEGEGGPLCQCLVACLHQDDICQFDRQAFHHHAHELNILANRKASNN